MKKIKILFSVLIVIVLISSTLSVYAYEIDGFNISNDIKYDGTWLYKADENTKTAKIYGYNGKDKDVVIPETIDDGYTVNELVVYSGDILYDDTFPVHFPIFDINETMETLTIPKTIELISSDFSNEIIGDDNNEDEREKNLYNVRLMHDEKIIMKGPFYTDLPNLKSFVVDEENPYFSSENGVLFNKDKSVLIAYPTNKTDEKYTVPDTITEIMALAFYRDCAQLKELIITENVKEIGWGNIIYDTTITVYENSFAYKYYAERGNLNVISNSSAEKEVEKDEPKDKDKKDDKLSPQTGDNTTTVAVFLFVASLAVLILGVLKNV